MIFKIQKPLFSTDGQPYLIYNKDRTIQNQSIQVGHMPELDEMFDDDEVKIYVKGYIDKKDNIVINRKVGEQDW